MSPLRLTIEDGHFRDSHGRQVTLRGINVAGDAKFPSNPDQPSHVPEDFFDGDNVNFHSRPFPREDAHLHFSRLKRWGYNTIRYVFTWEAIESAGPGIYDEEWIIHTIEILRLAKDYGFYIFMDPHQDVVGVLHLYSIPIPADELCTVVEILWRFWGSYVDGICLRTESSKLCCNRSSPRTQHISRARELPQNDMVNELHSAGMPSDIHNVLCGSRLHT
jgi:Cellulase (glycosyl hydrolase family 5)